MSKELEDKLIEAALSISKKAYAPYSGYQVGAALLTHQGNIYTGCNVENASFSLTICAERSAVFQAISAGERKFELIVIYVDSEKDFPPCGACRQVLAEFMDDLEIILVNKVSIKRTNLKSLLPNSFSL